MYDDNDDTLYDDNLVLTASNINDLGDWCDIIHVPWDQKIFEVFDHKSLWFWKNLDKNDWGTKGFYCEAQFKVNPPSSPVPSPSMVP